MIDLLVAEKELKNYVEKYDSKNPKIIRKVQHSYRVVESAEKISKSLNLSEEDVNLAKLIALLHDIGRFEQIRIYDTFSDKDSIDHADLGVEILFKNNYIRKFIEDDKYDKLIYKAIKNHNKYKIEEGLNDKELLHAKIIRDADKTDIFRLYIIDIEKNENILFDYEKIAKEKISDKVLDAIKEHRLVNSIDCVNEVDKYLRAIAFVFDFNFEKGLEITKENQYIEKLINRVKTKDNMEIWNGIYNIVNEYREKRIR